MILRLFSLNSNIVNYVLNSERERGITKEKQSNRYDINEVKKILARGKTCVLLLVILN